MPFQWIAPFVQPRHLRPAGQDSAAIANGALSPRAILRPMELMIVAGEASGDLHAARLVSALRRRHPDWRFFGCGGDRLEQVGCELLIHARELAVVGLFEVVRHLPGIYARYRKLKRAMAERRPAGIILVDFPDFNLRLARAAFRAGVPALYFISPQLWAWRTGRVELIRRYIRRMICIFPFEQEFYAQHGLDVDYVGHPLVDTVHPRFSRDEFFRQHGLDPEAPLVALLPGSRHREIDFHLDTMLEAARLLRSRRSVQFVLPVAGTLNVDGIREKVPVDLRDAVHVIAGDSYDAAAHARCAVVSSGTATVETALLGTPMVVIYRLSDWTYRLGKRWVKTPFYAMVNLILGEAAVPELIQDEFYPAAIVDWAERLLDDTVEREAQIERLLQVRQRLGTPGAMDRAAFAVERALFPSGVLADRR